jgi:hypothetical protein
MALDSSSEKIEEKFAGPFRSSILIPKVSGSRFRVQSSKVIVN